VVEVVESVGVFLFTETSSRFLAGRPVELVTALIDGRRTDEQIVDLLAGKLSAPEVHYALAELERWGYLVEPNDEAPSTSAAYWEALKVSGGDASRQLARSRIGVVTCGAISEECRVAVVHAAESLGLGLVEHDEPELNVVVTDDYLQEALADVNDQALRSGTPYLLVKPVGTRPWVGPLIDPRHSACWECLAVRLRDNRPVERFVLRHQGRSFPLVTSRGTLTTTSAAAVQIAVTEVAKWFATGRTAVDGSLLTVDTVSWDTEQHLVTKRPQCRACGEPDTRSSTEPVGLVLTTRSKAFTSDGGHRTCSPEETIRTYQRHVSPVTGAIAGINRLDGRSGDVLHAYSAGHNFALGYSNISLLRKSLRSNSGGKGTTDVQARASAMCEALERYSGVYRGDEPRHRATFAEMGGLALRPNDCMLYSEAQFRQRATLNRQERRYQFVPAPFDEQAEIDWTPLWSLNERRFKYLPTAYLYYGYNDAHGLDVRYGTGFAWADSNGNAAGNTREEAILQAFMEVIERDSVALWWFSRVNRPLVDLSSFDEPYFAALQECLERRGREMWVLDITSDLGIPSFAAISRRVDSSEEQVVVGFGAHFEARLAALRALTEVNQFLVAFDHVDENLADNLSFDPDALNWWSTATLDNQPYLAPREGAPRTAAHYADLSSDDLREDVLTCSRLVERHGMEALVLDQTRPDIGLAVVKVVVPGMRHFWARLAPGRLYEVPVRLGWLERPLDEDELNPIPIFF
jgi:ribosomal protein S12 methylthiotransferase accessory factor